MATKTWSWTGTTAANDFSLQFQGQSGEPYVYQTADEGLSDGDDEVAFCYRPYTKAENGTGTTTITFRTKYAGNFGETHHFRFHPFIPNTGNETLGVHIEQSCVTKFTNLQFRIIGTALDAWEPGNVKLALPTISIGSAYDGVGTVTFSRDAGGTYYCDVSVGTLSSTGTYFGGAISESNTGIIRYAFSGWETEDPPFYIRTSTHPFPTVVEPTTSDFYYVGKLMGTDGTVTSGQVDFSTEVLTVSPIQQSLGIFNIEGAFNPIVNVTLNNIDGKWNTFVNPNYHKYTPPGFFYLKDSGTLLFTGVCNYLNTNIDTLNKTVTLQLNSILSRVEDITVSAYSTFNKFQEIGTISNRTISFKNGTNYTIVYVDGDYFANEKWVEKGEFVRIKDSEVEYALDLVSTYTGTVGTLTIKGQAAYLLNIGGTVERRKRYPEDLQEAPQKSLPYFFQDVIVPSLTAKPDVWGGAYTMLYLQNVAWQWMDGLYFKLSKYLFGGESLFDVINTMCDTYNMGLSCYNGQTIVCTAPSANMVYYGGTYTTLNFETDIFFPMSYTQENPLLEIKYNYGQTNENDSYPHSYTYVVDTNSDSAGGEIKTINTFFFRDLEQVADAAFNLSTYKSRGAGILQFRTNLSHFADVEPGQYIAFSNMPTDFSSNASNPPLFFVITRTYNYDTKLIDVVARNLGNAVDFHWFTVGTDYINGTEVILG